MIRVQTPSPNLRRRRRGLPGHWANPMGRTHLRVQRKAVDEAASRWRSAPAATTRRVMTSLRPPRSPGIRLKSPTSVRGARNLWEGLIYPRFPRLSVWVDRVSSLVRSPVSGYLRDLRARRYLSCQSVGPLAPEVPIRRQGLQPVPQAGQPPEEMSLTINSEDLTSG